MNAGALSPTSIPNDVTGVKNRLVRMIMAKVMRVRVFILSSCYFLVIRNIRLFTSLQTGGEPPAVESDVDPKRRLNAEDR